MFIILVVLLFLIPILFIILLVWDSKRVKPFKRIKKKEENKYYDTRGSRKSGKDQ